MLPEIPPPNSNRIPDGTLANALSLSILESLIESFIELMSQVFMLPIFHRRTSC